MHCLDPLCVWSKSGVFGGCVTGHQGFRVFVFADEFAAHVNPSTSRTERLENQMVKTIAEEWALQHLILGCHFRWMWERKKKKTIKSTKYHVKSTSDFGWGGCACFSWANAPSGGQIVEYKRIETNWRTPRKEQAYSRV